jgi:hypothetical protein
VKERFHGVKVLGLMERDLFLYELYKAENKNRPSSAFDRQYTITPPLHHSMVFKGEHIFWKAMR